MRILITGSQDWTEFGVIVDALSEYHTDGNILVSGACPNGADRMCEMAGDLLGWQIERHPAKWKLYGRQAGFLRNAEMVHLGAQVCIGFLRPCRKPTCTRADFHWSHGTSHTLDLAEKAGIPIVRREDPR